jgi:putative copper export protein
VTESSSLVSGVLVASGVRWLTLLSMAAVLGALTVDMLVIPSGVPAARLRRWATVATLVLLLATLGELIIRAATMTGPSWAALRTGLPAVVSRTHFGRIWLARLAGIVVIALLAWRESRRARGGALGLAAGVALTVALTGHLADGGDVTRAVGLDWVHILAAGAWTGGLAALAALSGRAAWTPPVLASVAARFSRLAGVCLLAVLLTGIHNAWILLPGLAALWTTNYGRFLAVKIGLVAGLAALGCVNRYAIVARLDGRGRRSWLARVFRRAQLVLVGPRPGSHARLPARFVTVLAAEATLGVAVFACTAVLGETPPARHAMMMDHRHVEEAPGPVHTTTEALHASGGVPRGWLFTPPAGDVARGRQVFARLQCYACHVVTGEGFPAPTGAGPELSGMGAHHPAGYLVESILNPNAVIVDGPGYTGSDGRSTMPDYRDALRVTDLIDLVAYLRSR